MVLSQKSNLKSQQVDCVQSITQAKLEEDVYMNMKSGFTYDDLSTSRQSYVLKIKQNLYGLKQDAMNWDFKIRDGLIFTGFKQSEIDPFLFIKYNTICSICLDDTIFFV